MEVRDSVIRAIMTQMPEGAERYLTESNGDYKLSIHWKLKNDKNRPNKYSKTIVITIPQELVEDFPAYPCDLQESALNKIGIHIRNQLHNFDPDHDLPRGMPEPVENWYIAIEKLFG